MKKFILSQGFIAVCNACGIHLVGARHSQGLAQKSSVGSAVPNKLYSTKSQTAITGIKHTGKGTAE